MEIEQGVDVHRVGGWAERFVSNGVAEWGSGCFDVGLLEVMLAAEQ